MAFFIVDPNLSDIPPCTITSVEVSTDGTTLVAPGSGFLNNGVTEYSGPTLTGFKITPQDPDLDKDYTFYIKVTDMGGQSTFLGSLVFKVGCSSATLSSITPANYQDPMLLVVASSGSSALYTFPSITLTKAYCPVLSYVPVNV